MQVGKEFRNLLYDPRGRCFILKMSYNAEVKNDLKSRIDFKKRRWDDKKKQWEVAYTDDTAEEMVKFADQYGFNVANSAKAILKHYEGTDIEDSIELPDLKVNLPLKGNLYDFQKKGVAYCLQNRNVIIGDVQGLGKTVQAIGAIAAEDLFPCLVICPAHLKLNWKKEWEDWTNKRVALMQPKIKRTAAQWFATKFLHVAICNYESLGKYFVSEFVKDQNKKIKKVNLNSIPQYFKSVIIDESHYCGNSGTKRYKITKELARNVDMRLALTGTPISNKVSEIINQLKIIQMAEHFGNAEKEYAGITKGNFGGIKENPRKLDEFRSKLQNYCYYRREKHEVLTQLPDKFRQVISVPLSNPVEYNEAKNYFEDYLRSIKGKTEEEIERALRGQFMVQIGELKKVAARGKIKLAKDFIGDVNAQGEKVVVFAHHREIIESLRQTFNDYVFIVGGMSDNEKNRSVEAFQNDPEVKGIIVSIQAGQTGLTLTAATKVVFIELPWTASTTDQCEDRLHRIGQNNNVNAYYLLGETTIDEKIYYDIIQPKRALSSQVTGAQDETKESPYKALIKEFLKSA